MLNTDPPEVSVPFCSNCICEDAGVGCDGTDEGETCLHREMVVPGLPMVVL